MILVDTSVWVDHLRHGNTRLRSLLDEAAVLTHPFIVGELACGNLRNRQEILRLLALLPEARIAEHAEVLGFLDGRRLYGRGIGWLDAHLLASALLSGTPLWTLDRKLGAVVSSLRIAT
jgi:hypothetical protein